MMIYLRYLKSLLLHKWYVFQAGLMINKRMQPSVRISIWRLLVHDMSKFSRFEFKQYARKYFGESDWRNEKDYHYAWLHHENNNPHHYGYWIPRSGEKSGEPLEMPTTYIYEMVADWMGAERTYTGSWDMTKWLQNNMPRVVEQCHTTTTFFIHGTLLFMGYNTPPDGGNYEYFEGD